MRLSIIKPVVLNKVIASIWRYEWQILLLLQIQRHIPAPDYVAVLIEVVQNLERRDEIHMAAALMEYGCIYWRKVIEVSKDTWNFR